jgi:hypothetical protein
MLVGSDAELLDVCAQAVPGVPVLRVGHAAAAVERMLVMRPLVVVVAESVKKLEVERVVDCARDIRAEVVHASKDLASELVATVRSALLTAERNREPPAQPADSKPEE